MRARTKYLILLMTVALAAAAGEPWKDKPYTQWSAKDVRKILRDSPWAKAVRIPYYPEQEFGGPPETSQKIQIGQVPDDPAKDPMAVPSAETQVYRPEGIYIVRWASSQTIRQALLRDAVLRGGVRPEHAGPQAAGAADEYELVLVSDTPNPLPPIERTALMRTAYLEAGVSGRGVSPTRVEIHQLPNSRVIQSVSFYFPKRDPEGMPLISTRETAVEFFVQAGPARLRARFNPSEMASRNGVDL